jgi:hypothetical protein
MPVQEALDGIAELTGLAGGPIPIGGIMINMTRPLALSADQVKAAAAGQLDENELAVGLKAAGLPDSRRLATELAAELSEHARTTLGQELQRERLSAPGQPCYELPWINDGMDLGGLYRLAAALRDQGAA